MKDIFLKHKIAIFRSLGSIMLVVGFALHFWVTPKRVLTQNERAAANVARMEAIVARGHSTSASKPKLSSAEILKHLKDTQEAQSKYLTIIAMIFGIGFLGYSFVGKKESVK